MDKSITGGINTVPIFLKLEKQASSNLVFGKSTGNQSRMLGDTASV